MIRAWVDQLRENLSPLLDKIDKIKGRLVAHIEEIVAPEEEIGAAFLPEAVKIEVRKPPRAARTTLYVILGFFIVALIWAALAEVDQVVTARGKLASPFRTEIHQSVVRSVIRGLHVEVGNDVEKSDVLADLVPAILQADTSEYGLRKISLETERDRIKAELSETDFKVTDKATNEDDRFRQVAEAQRAIYEKRESQRIAELAILDARIEILTARIAEVESQRQQIIAETSHVDNKISTEFAKGDDIRKKQDLEDLISQRTILEIKADEKDNEKTRLDKEIQYIYSEVEHLKSQRILNLSMRKSTIDDELRKIDIIDDLGQIKARCDGDVFEMTSKSEGSILEAGEVIFSLIPSGGKVSTIEIEIGPKDIGRLNRLTREIPIKKKGCNEEPGKIESRTQIAEEAWNNTNLVRIKLDSLPFQRHGTLEGRLIWISPDAYQRDAGGTVQIYYRGQVRLDDKIELRNAPEESQLLPGTPVTAEIKVGKRSVLSYVIYPFTRALDESMNEPN